MSTDNNHHNNSNKRSSDYVSDNEPDAKAPRRAGDDKPPPSDDAAELKWRKDPTETYSDWTLEIVHKKEDGLDAVAAVPQVDIYHVHKASLACGIRKSDYFHRLFQNGHKFPEGAASTSRIELEPLEAKVFPDLLDYFYDPRRELKVSTDTATILHHFGEYFEVDQLRWDVLQFCKKDMSVENVHKYAEHAMMVHNGAIQEIIAKFVGKNIKNIEMDHDIIKQSDPQMWMAVSKQVDREDEEACHDLCFNIGEFFKQQKEHLDVNTYKKLTTEDIMPQINPGSALLLSALEDYAKNKTFDNHKGPIDGLSPLQERCTSAITKDPSFYVRHENRKKVTGFIRDRSPAFQMALLFKSWEELEEYKKKLEELEE